MRILLIGGNGNISWWCAREALKRNHEVTIITRGLTWATRRDPLQQAKYVLMDINNLKNFESFLKENHFDVISDFLNYDAPSTASRFEILSKHESKYVVISSTIIYERNESTVFLKENSRLRQIGFSPYVDGKLMIERLIKSHSEMAKRTLIIRPSHTFDTNVPTPLGSNCFTEVSRVLGGGNLLIPEDGTKHWTLMHSEDFSTAWVELIERESSFGDVFNVVNTESMTWNEVSRDVLSVLEISHLRIKYVRISDIESIQISGNSSLNGSNLGSNFSLHRKWSDQYNNSKLIKQIPGWTCTRSFKDGFFETMRWLNDKPERQRLNPTLSIALADLDMTVKNIF